VESKCLDESTLPKAVEKTGSNDVGTELNSRLKGTNSNADNKPSTPDILNSSSKQELAYSEVSTISDLGDAALFSDNSFVSNTSEFTKVYEPLKSVQLLRNMRQNLSAYLPKHSAGSDSEID